jgi:hypothetical protein
MSRRSPVYAALLLTVVAGITIFADEQGRNAIEVNVRKIVTESETKPSASTKQEGRADNVLRSRVLFIIKKGCERCETELSRLRSSGGDFEKLQLTGWRIGTGAYNHIQIVDHEEIPELMQLLKTTEFPTVACIVDGEIVRSFKDGCTTPLDVWTFGWLLKGENERPRSMISEAARVESTGNYRLRGNHWTVEGDPNPSKDTVLKHLRGIHGNSSAAYGTIDNWSTEELRSLHDDIHEREGGGAVATTYSGPAYAQPANRSLDAFSGSRKVLGR